MTNNSSMHKEKKILLLQRIKQKIFFLFRLNHHPVIKVYNGWGNAEKIIVLGHVLRLSPLPRQTYRQNWVTNLFSLLRMFMVIPFSHAKIAIEWDGVIFNTETEEDGFFRFEIFPAAAPGVGWKRVLVRLEEKKYHAQHITGIGYIYIPFDSAHAFISDIDDTFLISHSSRLRRRLYVLFTKNARSRKPFEGVVNHYQLLAGNGQTGENINPFFYVSGSEWNLYDLILEFSRSNDLPKGVYLLSHLKRINEFWKSGQSNLTTKFRRISRIIDAYPHLQFILLGDDSQQDPDIYSSIVSHFPGKIFAVYMRRVRKSSYEKVQLTMDEMEIKGVNCCYFKHSAEAVIHSKMIGLIV
jgi:phosphatidate phosphatase APP1